MKTETKALIDALRILSVQIYTENHADNSLISEAADRLEELSGALKCCNDVIRRHRNDNPRL